MKIGEFYQNCKVIGTEEEKSRILLLEACRRVMAQSFYLIGMKTIDKIWLMSYYETILEEIQIL